MDASRLTELENAVERLLQRNQQLQEHCRHLLDEQEVWCHQKRDLLGEVNGLLSQLQGLKGEQS